MAAFLKSEKENPVDTLYGPHDQEKASPYSGSGTASDPYIVEFRPDDPCNPLNFPTWRKWLITSTGTIAVFAVTLTSTAYSAAPAQIMAEFHASDELFATGIALFVLGFGVGPPLWAPLSELYGRRILFVTSLGLMTAFIGATAGCNSIASFLVFRFLCGVFGASPISNTGGLVADLFSVADRGLAATLFSVAPSIGPVIGPIIGGFVAIKEGWRWVQGICCIFVGIIWIIGFLLVPETYGPVLLRRIARRLSQATGKFYISVIEKERGITKPSEVFGRTLRRPWVLLFMEPIVLIASLYLTIIYGTIYLLIPAFPIVFEQQRGWNEGIGSLPFLGLVVGMLLGITYIVFDQHFRYNELGNTATPESRLPPGAVGAVAMPIGLFGFAWTNFPSIHWSASVIMSAPFGFGSVLVFYSVIIYLMDAYTIFAASVIAASAMTRAIIGASFPLFTTQMFHNLGIHWAGSIPAFLTLACLPFPFVMYKYGAQIRMKCKYSHEAAVLLERMQALNKQSNV